MACSSVGFSGHKIHIAVQLTGSLARLQSYSLRNIGESNSVPASRLWIGLKS